jgi:hypothetical protein
MPDQFQHLWVQPTLHQRGARIRSRGKEPAQCYQAVDQLYRGLGEHLVEKTVAAPPPRVLGLYSLGGQLPTEGMKQPWCLPSQCRGAGLIQNLTRASWLSRSGLGRISRGTVAPTSLPLVVTSCRGQGRAGEGRRRLFPRDARPIRDRAGPPLDNTAQVLSLESEFAHPADAALAEPRGAGTDPASPIAPLNEPHRTARDRRGHPPSVSSETWNGTATLAVWFFTDRKLEQNSLTEGLRLRRFPPCTLSVGSE